MWLRLTERAVTFHQWGFGGDAVRERFKQQLPHTFKQQLPHLRVEKTRIDMRRIRPLGANGAIEVAEASVVVVV